MKTKRRNDLDICADILRVAQGGARKTRIVYQSNLNFRIVKRYLASLLQRGFLELEGSLYQTTDRATAFLEAYENILSFNEA